MASVTQDNIALHCTAVLSGPSQVSRVVFPSRMDHFTALVEHFVEVYARRMSKQIEHIPPETMSALSSYQWPGNIRASEFHRAERYSYFGKRPALPSHEFEDCRHGGIDRGNYSGERGARSHSQDSRANPVGSLRSQRGGRTFGNQEVHPLLPHAKAGHLTFEQGTDACIAELQWVR
jgi:hypothetical protein